MTKKQKYTFEQWCIDHDRHDLLDRWDYEMTGFGPGDITYSSAKPIYFKCPNGVHESERRKVYVITSPISDQKNFRCKECMKEYPIIDDLTGRVFGELTVVKPDLERTKSSNCKGTYWFCECSCGKTTSILGSVLKEGRQITCGDRSIHWSGENNTNWKGGITPKLLRDRTSREYDLWRNAVYKKDWYTCQCCGAYGSNVEKNAHHIRNFSDYEDIKYSISNGICLCSECHHIKNKGSFHNIYGTRNNTPQQLEEYINERRKSLSINTPFSLESYLAGNVVKPNELIRSEDPIWIFDEIDIADLNKKIV